jgi:hypothetical protein
VETLGTGCGKGEGRVEDSRLAVGEVGTRTMEGVESNHPEPRPDELWPKVAEKNRPESLETLTSEMDGLKKGFKIKKTWKK